MSRNARASRSCCSPSPPGCRTARSTSGAAGPAHAELVEPDVVRELVANRARHLVAEQVGVVAKITPQRVAEDDYAVGVIVAGRAVALVEAVSAATAPAVGDHDRDVVVRDQ